MAIPVTPFALRFLQFRCPAPWRLQGAEVIDRNGSHVYAFDEGDPDEVEFWRGSVEAVNGAAGSGRCGTHIDQLHLDDGDPVNLAGSGPTPIEPREG